MEGPFAASLASRNKTNIQVASRVLDGKDARRHKVDRKEEDERVRGGGTTHNSKKPQVKDSKQKIREGHQRGR